MDGIEMMKGLDHFPGKKRLRELGLDSLEKTRLREDPINPYRNLQGVPEDGARLCSEVPVTG